MGTFQRSWLTQPRIKTLSSRWLQQYFAFWPHLLEQLPKWASMHKRGKNFFCSFSSCKYANWCNFQALPLPNLINRSWRHRIVSDFLLLLLLLYIISLAFKIEHCEFEDLLGIFLLSKYLGACKWKNEVMVIKNTPNKNDWPRAILEKCQKIWVSFIE